MASTLTLDLRVVQAMLRAGKATHMLRRWVRQQESKRSRKPIPLSRQVGLGKLGFRCDRLGCCLSIASCIARQAHTDSERPVRDPSRPVELSRHDGKRGTAYTFPYCDTLRCDLGRSLRQQYGDDCAAHVRHGKRVALTPPARGAR